MPVSFGSSNSANVEENTEGVVRDVNASLNGGNVDEGLTYSITGGADQALFDIDSTTGAISFVSSPDYENPLDAGGDNIYNITVTASDGGANSDTQDLTITVTDDVVEATATPVTQGTIRLSDLGAGQGFTIGGGPAGDYAGTSVSSAGDINGDGFDDVVIGAPNSWYFASGTGMAYVIFGRAGDVGSSFDLTSLDGANGFSMTGLSMGSATGTSVSSAGDVNGDGFDDLLIGAYGASPNGYLSGQTYLIFGTDSGFSATVDLSSLDGSNGVTFNGSGAFDMAGAAVAAAGDINGDGIDDFLIGASGSIPFFGSGTSAGKTYVVFGTNSGYGASMDLASLDGSNGFVINGVQVFDMAGARVSSAGDVNGDGYDDIVIGAPGVGTNGSYSGAAYVLFGSGSGFSASVDLANLDGTNGFLMSGLAAGDRTGWAVSSAGDINGDGYDDILVGASFADTNDTDSGATYVVFGGPDSFPASVDLSSLDGSNGFVINGGTTSDAAGRSVSALGDINGDGYDDILIGATGVSPNGYYSSGGTYVILGHGGSFDASFNLLDVSRGDGSDGFMLAGIDANDGSGRAVSSAGDVNGDGFVDFIVGAPNAGAGGEAYIVYGEPITPAVQFTSSATHSVAENTTGVLLDIDASLNSGTADDGLTYSITGGADQASFSIDSSTGVLSINTTPDYEARNDAGNNNTYQVTVTASGGGLLNNQQTLTFTITNDTADDQSGVEWLFELDGNTGFVVNGIGKDDFSARSVSSAGDINGDGYDDIIVGAHGSDANGENSGQAYVVFGHGGDFDATRELFSLDGSNGFILNGVNAFDGTGFSVSSAGDVNGDGYDDILVGAHQADPNGYSTGSTYVVFGAASGFGPTFDLTSLNGTNGFVLNGTVAYERSGHSVSSAGDVNGDGYDDILLGAYGASPNGSASGATYVVFGAASGFSASMDLSSLDGSNGFVINGVAADDRSGRHVSSAGDINGDGFDDILIGAYGVDTNGSQSGATYVVFGSASGFSASMDLSSLDGSNGFVINGLAAYDWTGQFVSSAGDINGDGFDDILVGSHGVDTNGDNSGATYVVFGSNSGFAASFDLSSLDGSNGFVINGVNANDRAGYSTSSAGDINGDGFDDILVGAYGSDPYFNNAGATYVIYGAASGFGASIELSTLATGDRSIGYVINGAQLGDSSGKSVSAAGDVNGDGVDDILIGAQGADPYSRDNGQTFVVFGAAPASPAVIGGNTDGSVGENETGTITGHLTISDANGAGEESFNNDSLDGTYGSLTIDANGDWAYNLDEGSTSVQALGTGGTLGDTFTVHSVDGTAQDITITINGVNDAPSAPHLSSSGVEENSAGAFVGRLSSRDPEGSTVSYTVNDDRFQVIGNQLWLREDVSLDFETTPTVSLRVVASDTEGRSTVRFVEISVVDIAEGKVDRGSKDNDNIIGTNADDTISGGGGNDSVAGGLGNDRVFAGKDDDGDDTVKGGDGNDTLGGGGGNDFVDGGSGSDLIWGRQGNDTLYGGDSDDVIYNGDGDDTVDGGDGDDTLWGGYGNDLLTGGTGSDTFLFGKNAGNDTVTDFSVADDILILAYATTDFTSLADVQAASSTVMQDGQSGLLIDLGGGTSVFLIGLTVEDFNAMDIAL